MSLGQKVLATLKTWAEAAIDFFFRIAYLPIQGIVWLISTPIATGLTTLINMQKSLLHRSGMYLPGVDEIISQANRDDAFTRIYTLGRLATALIDLYTRRALDVYAVPMIQKLNADTRFKVTGVPEAVAAYFRGDITLGELNSVAAQWGFNASQLQTMISGSRSLLGLDAIRDGSLRNLLTDAATTEKLAGYGFKPEEIALIKKLFFYIPPAPDLIRMAVREAFSPEIAERFGQYEDFPPDFAKWAAQQGISDFWAKAYWAAHWDLPSPLQGFEMLHRGVASEADLKLLLRALDVMPFWREKLIQISYNPYTRVDTRRMYNVGVINAQEVKRAYMDLGYDNEKAEKMTQFTIAINTETERDLTKADILDGFKRNLLPEGEAIDLLLSMGYDEREAHFYIEREKQKREEAKKKQVETNVKRKYERGIFDEAQATGELLKEGFTQGEIDELLDMWIRTKSEQVYVPTVSDLKSFLAGAIIAETEFTEELRKKGMSDKHISWYVQLARKGAA